MTIATKSGKNIKVNTSYGFYEFSNLERAIRFAAHAVKAQWIVTDGKKYIATTPSFCEALRKQHGFKYA